MNYYRVGLKKRVVLVLLPIDDFTDQIITGSGLRMYTLEGKKPSIRKADGYHVFCDLEGGTARICIDGPLYQKQVLNLPLGDGGEIHQVRMLPGSAYPVPPGATLIRGRLKPGSRIRLYFPEQKKNYKLLYDYEPKKDGKSLPMFQPEIVRLEGKTLCIQNQKEPEFFRVADQEGEICRLEQPLRRSYKKIGTNIYPVYEAFAKEDGSVYLPIRLLPAEQVNACVRILEEPGGEERVRTITLYAGKENRIAEKEGEDA